MNKQLFVSKINRLYYKQTTFYNMRIINFNRVYVNFVNAFIKAAGFSLCVCVVFAISNHSAILFVSLFCLFLSFFSYI